MQMTSLTFLAFFLPLCLLCCYVVPARFRNAVLLLFSLLFFASNGIVSLGLACISVLCDFFLGRTLCRLREKRGLSRVVLWTGIVKNLFLFLFFSVCFQLWGTPLPLGIRVYPLLSLGYLLEVSQRTVPAEQNLVRFSLGNLFFARVPVGPLGVWRELQPQLRHPNCALHKVGEGLTVFVRGLAKKVLLADGLLELFGAFSSSFLSDSCTLAAWAMLLCLSLGVYFYLSGYSDMARGLGLVFGFELPLNFYYPFSARSVYEFFSRFNMTLTRFVRRQVFFRLNGEGNGLLSSALNLLLTSMLFSLWYGFSLNLLVWGIFLGIIIVAERLFLQKLLRRLPNFFKHLYTVCIVFLSFAFFGSASLAESGRWIGAMFGIGSADFVSSAALYLLSQGWLVMLLGVFVCTSLPKRIASVIRARYYRAFSLVSIVCDMGLLLLTMTALALSL